VSSGDANYVDALDDEIYVDAIRSGVLLGGYGIDDGLAPGAKVDFYFTERGVWLAKAGSYRPYLRRSYEESRALAFEGGAFRKGGGFVGGGFGLIGAAEGMAISSLLNSLTKKTKVHTTIQYEAEDAEVFVFTDEAVPRTFEVRLAKVRAQIRASQPVQAAPSGRQSEDFTLASCV
jgi:hypothetical protein